MERMRLRSLVVIAAVSVLAAAPSLLGQGPAGTSDPPFRLEEERAIGPYTVQVFLVPEKAWEHGERVVTLSRPGMPTIEVEWVFRVDPKSGTDITGEGNPDLILECYSGGAHCCFSTIVYDLGAVLTVIPVGRESNCSGYFEDLDGDAILEFVTCDDAFAYAYCPYCASPTVRAILRYEPGRGYVPAGPRFAHLYIEEIARDRALAEKTTPGEMGEWDQTTKCAVLPLVLDYLYSGEPETAWQVLERYYPFPDRAAFREEIERTVKRSPLYRPQD